tara:strand:- start:39 stop:1007 length:969 start_codon:yes stop_codon:yes gene_type:complete
MKLFNQKKGSVDEVKQVPFKLERDIQDLVEKNTDSIFNLLFIQSELRVDKYRIDSLCFDEENNSFVIIEYKKGSSYSVIDQGYTYLQLLLNNKSDFLLVLSQHFNKVFNTNEIDWSQSKIIFVSPSFNSYQKDSVNFKNLPFELWEIKRFSNNTLIFNLHKSSSNESIQSLNSSKNKNLISSVSKEVKVYDIEDLISNISQNNLDKWNEIVSRLNEMEGVELKPKKNYVSIIIGGVSFKTILYLRFQKSKMKIRIIRGVHNPDGYKGENYFTIDDPKNVTTKTQRTLNNGSTQKFYEITVDNDFDIDYLMFLIKQKYNNINK